MKVGPPPLVDVTWALVQTLPVNNRIHEELNTMGGRCVRVLACVCICDVYSVVEYNNAALRSGYIYFYFVLVLRTRV